MKTNFKRVPAVDKCFAILDLFARSKQSLGISDIAKKLQLNKSTVFNIVNTLTDLGILENGSDSKYRFGARLYTLGRAAGSGSELIRTVRPYLAKISEQIKLSAFLGIRSGLKTVILDKVDSSYDLKISSEVGMRLPLLAGSTGPALLSQLPDHEIDALLSSNELKKFTPRSCADKEKYKENILKVREEGVAVDMEEYLEGIVALAAPINTRRDNLQAAVWAVGLKRQMTAPKIREYSKLLKEVAQEINVRFFLG